MKKLSARRSDELRPEYDLSQLKGGVRGKYYREATAGTNLVLIEPDLADVFPDAESVNIEGMREDGQPIPPPSSSSEVVNVRAV